MSQVPTHTSDRPITFRMSIGKALAAGALFGLGARELLKVSISPEGIGPRRRPIYWREIAELERNDEGFFLRHWQIHATYQPTVMVENAVAARPEFRDAVERLSPSDSPIRDLTAVAGWRTRGHPQGRALGSPPEGEPGKSRDS